MKKYKFLFSLIIIVIPMFCFGQMKSSVQQSTAVPIEFSLERTASQISSFEEKKGRTHYQLYINGALKTLDAEGNPSYIISWLGNRKIYQYTLEKKTFTGYSGDNVEILRRSHSNFYGDFSPCTTFTLEEGKTIYLIKCQ
jgi:hypothetical protein